MLASKLGRRDINRLLGLTLVGATLPVESARSPVSQATAASASAARRVVTKQRLPGEPAREIVLVEVTYPPGTGSPKHVHPNGVMAYVVSGAVASQVGEAAEHTYHAGDSWWEPPGATHRISRNASSTEPAVLLAIYIAPQNATPEDLMKPA